MGLKSKGHCKGTCHAFIQCIHHAPLAQNSLYALPERHHRETLYAIDEVDSSGNARWPLSDRQSALGLLLLFVIVCQSQTDTGRILGTVTDQTAALRSAALR